MLDILLGIEILVKLLQPLNASDPMLETLLGIEMLVKLLQPLNARSPMLVTLYTLPSILTFEGIFTESRSL